MMKSTNAAPVISVLMSCYNAARWLDEAINSVLNQTFKDFEFVIVDDGSEDETLEIINRFAKRDSRIVVIAKRNTGLAGSLNVGIEKARGQWIARIDADDICEPTRLKKQLELARMSSGLVFIGTGLTEIDEDGTQLKTYRYPSSHATLLKHLRIARKFPPHSSAFYPAETVRSIGGYRPRIRRAQDWDLWLRLSEVGELACMSEPLVRIRKHAEQISHDDLGRRQMIDSSIAITSYFLRLQGFSDPVAADESSFDSFRAWIEQRLEEEGIYAFQHSRAQFKTLYYCVANTMAGVPKVISFALRQPDFMLRFLRQRMVGENLPRRLAWEWINQS